MTTNNIDQSILNTNENPANNPSTSTDVPSNNEYINILSDNNPTTATKPADNTTASADSNAPQPLSTGTTDDDESKTATSSAVALSDASNESGNVQSSSTNITTTNQEEKSTLPTANSDNQITNAESLSTNNSSANDVTQSEPSKTPVSNKTQSEIFPPTPTNTLEDQEMFNDTARAVFTKPTDNQTNTSGSDANTFQSSPSNTTETNKSKKSPAPLAKSIFVDAKNTQSPSDITITISEPPSNAPISTEKEVSPNEKTNLEPELVSPPPITSPTGKHSLAAHLHASPRLVVTFVITFLIPLTQLIIGWHFADDCPIRWRIPHYLVVSGIIGIIIFFLAIIINLLKFSGKLQSNTQNPAINCGFLLLALITLVLGLFLIGWFIAGCVWVFRVFNKVQFNNPNRGDYCHPVLYRFAYWLLLLALIFTIFNLYRSYKRLQKASNFRNKDNLIPVPTSEP